MKKILSILCALALVLCLPGTAALADTPGAEAPLPDDDMFQLGQASEYGEAPVVSSLDDDETLTASWDGLAVSLYSDLPSAYDMRDTIDLPSVRNQGTWSTCWAMAATAAAEVNGLSWGLLGTDAADTDLSERHLIYFMTHQADDPLGNSSGDYNTNMSYWISGGGNPIMASMTMASWHGMASEAATNSAYSGLSKTDSIDSAYAYTDALHLENTCALDISTDAGRNTLKQLLLDGSGAVLCLYYDSTYLFAGSPTQAAATPAPTETPEPTDDPEPTADAEATETPEPTADPEATPDPEPVPTQTPEQSDDPAPTPEQTPEQEEDTPEQDADLQPVPAVSLDGATDGQDDEDVPEAGNADDPDPDDYTVCYYQDAISEKTNHEVLIVGWDDDYPAENFGYSSMGATPPGNGAWLCRNSYGDSWKGADGYFWVSYYDVSISSPSGGKLESARAVVFQFADADNYDNLYEYDGAAVMGYINDTIDDRGVSTGNATESTRRWYGNVFTASANPGGTELLKAVSTFTYRAQVPYTLTIYVDPTDPADPTSGTLAYTQEGLFLYAGLHTLTLDEPMELTDGQQYAVIFEVAMDIDGSLYVPACYTLNSWRAVNDSAAGQSFVSLDGSTWYDCYDLTRRGNVRIKAYTDNVPLPLPFQDVDQDEWYYDAVYTAYFRGLVTGMDEATFAPEADATRAQAITLLHRLSGAPAAQFGTSFDDVTKQWYYEAVSWAQEAGLAQGSDDDGDGRYSFRPDDAITREEFVTLLYRWAQTQGLDVTDRADLADFADADSVSDWALEAQQWSVAAGVQLGSAQADGTSMLLPDAPITRAQMTAMLLRLDGLLNQ